MGIKSDDIERLQAKFAGFFAGMAEDLEHVGTIGAEAIVQTTLAGIGEDDQPFAPYSQQYAALLASVGGKQRGVVDLRGIFLHDDQTLEPKRKLKGEQLAKWKENRRRQGAFRQAYVRVTVGGRTFIARTKQTRPQVGPTDPLSEMSLDLISVKATDSKLTIMYTPRSKEYMIYHQHGEGKNPQRLWFTARKAAVERAMINALKLCIKARVQWFNDHNSGGTPPTGANV